MFIAFIIVLLAEIFSVQGNIVTVIGDTPIDLGQPIDDFNAPSKLLDTVVSSTIKLENEEEELKALELAGSDATESLPEALPNHLLLYEDSRELLRSNERNLTREKRRHSTHSLNNDPHLERNRKESRSDQLSNAEIQRDIERERHREREIALEREKDRSLSTARDDYSDHRGDILSDRSGTLGTSIIRPQSLSSIELERKREEDRRREIEREIEKSKRRKGDSLRQSQSYNRLRDIERERERERNRDSDRWRHGTKDIQREKDRAERGGRPNRYEGSSREKPPILIYEEVTRYVDRDQKTIDGRPVWPASDRRPSRYRHPSLGGSFDTRAPDRPVYLDRRPERLPGVPDKYEEYDMDPELIPVYEEAHFIGGVGPSPILGAQIVGAQLAGAQLAQLAGAKLASAHLAGAQLAAGAQAATAQAATAQAVGAQAAISQALLANEAIKATQVEQAALAAHLAAAQAGKAHAVADSVGAAAVLKHDLAHKLKIHLKNRLAQKITEQTALSGLAQGAALTGAVHGAALSGAAHGAALSGAAHGAALSGAAHGAALSGAAHGAALSGAAHGATLSGAAHGSALTGAAQGTALSGAAHGIALGGAAHGAALSGAVHGAALTGAAQGAALTGAAHGAALSGASHAAALSGAAHGAAQSGAAHGAALGGAVHVAALGGAAHGAALSGAAHGAALGGAVHGAALGGAAHGAALSGAAHGAALGGALSGAAHGVALSGAAHGAALSGAAHGTALSGAAHGAALSGFRIADSAHFIKAREHLLQRLKLFKPYFKIAGGSGYTMPTSIPRIPVGVELTHVEVEALPTIAIQSPVTLSTPPVSIPGLKGVLKPPLDSEYVEYILALPDEIFQNVALMSKREFLLTLFPTLFRDSVRDLTFEKIVEEPSLSYGAPIYPPLASPPPVTPADSYGAPPPLDSYGAPPEDSYGAPPTFSVHPIALPYPSTPHIQVTTHHPIITTISDSYEAPKAPSHSYGPPSPPIITTPAPPFITTLPPFIITSPAAPGEHYGPPDPPSEGYGAPQPPKAPSPVYGVPPKAHHCHHDGNYHHDSTSAQKAHDSFHDVTHKPLFTLKPSSIFSSTSGHQTFFTSTPITPIATSSSYADLDGLGEENTHFGKYHILKGGKIVPDITNTVVHTGTTKSLSQFQAYKNHHLTTPHFKPSPIDASPHATNIPIEIKIHEADFGPGPIHVTISEPSNGKGPIYVTTSQPHFDRHNTSVSATLTMPFPSVGSNFNVVTLRPPRGGSSNIRNTTKKSPVGFHFPTSSPFKFPPIKPAVVSSTHNPTPTVILGVGLRPHGSEQEFFSPVTSTISPPFTSIATLFPKTTVIPTTARPSPLTSISSLIPTTTVIPKTTLYPLTSIFSTTTARPITSSSSVAVVTPAILTNSYTHTVPSTTVAPHTSSSYIPPLSTTSSVAATTSRPFSTTSLKPNFLTTIKDIVTSLRPSLTTTRPPFIITPQPVYTTPKPDLRPTFSSTINPLFTTTIRSFPTTVAPSTSYSIPGGSFPSTGGFPPILGNFPITSDSFPTSIGSFPTTLGSFPTTFPSTTSSTNNPFIPVTTSSPIQPETSPVFVIQETPATPTSSTVFTLSPSVINNGQFLPTRPSSDDNDAILISDIVNTTPGTVLMKIKAGNQGNVFDRIPGTDENDDSHILSPFLKRKGNATHPQTGHTVTSSNRGSKTFIGSPPEEGADGADENNWQPLGPEVQDESSFIVRDCRGGNGVLPRDNVPETLISSKDYDANDPFSLYSDAIDSILSNKASRLNLSFSSFSNNSSSAAASTSHMSQDEFPDVEDVDDIDISANEYYDPKDPFKLYSDVIEDILLKKFIRLENHSAPLNDNKNKSSTNDVFGDPPLDLSFSGIPPQSFIDVQVLCWNRKMGQEVINLSDGAGQRNKLLVLLLPKDDTIKAPLIWKPLKSS
ncbi:hypothetical protein SK128_015771 [Halocaridina rubra]|uniref:Uncharacterized protein n=1 Tax=Halocaridina rubra TaxID=373956 RepID=A0AAN8WVC7_HALRR